MILKLTFSQNNGKYSENTIDIEKSSNKVLVAILDTIYKEDRKYRTQEIDIEKKYGLNSEECRKIWEKILDNEEYGDKETF